MRVFIIVVMGNPQTEKYLEHFLGAVLGTFVGDALGEPVEGWSKEAIVSHFRILDRFVGEVGRYTDDTEMMIGVLETFLEQGRFDPAVCARCFERNFHPRRGYGRRISGVMGRIRQGMTWDLVGTDSFGNGGAMRVAPVGCFYFQDLERVKKAAIQSAQITHTHPEGVAGAVAQAAAVGFALGQGLCDAPFDGKTFVKGVADQVKDIHSGFWKALLDVTEMAPEPLESLMDSIGRRYALSLRAIESVPAALAAFVWTSNFRDAVVVAVNLGGDTDTIGAMTGAIAGAYYGYHAIPTDWLDTLENGEKGRDYVINCVRKIVQCLEVTAQNGF